MLFISLGTSVLRRVPSHRVLVGDPRVLIGDPRVHVGGQRVRVEDPRVHGERVRVEGHVLEVHAESPGGPEAEVLAEGSRTDLEALVADPGVLSGHVGEVEDPGSPRKRSRSPRKRSRSPRRRSKSPRKRSKSPQKKSDPEKSTDPSSVEGKHENGTFAEEQ